jgi:adenosine deaminase
MKRNVGGERDLDYIIAAALRGMDRACLDYGIKAGLVFCLAREFDYELNEILVKKAEKYREHGVIGIDLAGPEQHTLELGEDVDRYSDLFARARSVGLGTTVHTGETSHTGVGGVLAVIDKLKPARIGHGIAAAQSDEAMRKLVEQGIVLEICPSSNLRTHAVADVAELRDIFARLRQAGVKLTINTDGTYLLGTHLRQELDLLLEHDIASEAEVHGYIGNARAATFIGR